MWLRSLVNWIFSDTYVPEHKLTDFKLERGRDNETEAAFPSLLTCGKEEFKPSREEFMERFTNPEPSRYEPPPESPKPYFDWAPPPEPPKPYFDWGNNS